MIRGLYTSALGMTTQMNKMDVISNNIANMDTTGYKTDKVVTRAFTEELMKRLDDRSDTRHIITVGETTPGVFVDDIYTDFSNGNLITTEGPLDMALVGEGFFVIEAEDNGNLVEKYTRDGAFTVDSERVLMTKQGEKVMGISGEIRIPDGNIVMSDNGDIYVDNEYVDTLRLTTFSDLHSLRKFRDNLYSTTDESEKLPFTGTVAQGSVENSNANSVYEMLEMITASRVYEANQRMITTHDSILSRTVNDLAKK